MASTVAFVDSITATPTMRLNLNDGVTWRTHLDGTELPPPPLRRSITQTMLTDGATIPAAVYDLRTIRLVLSVTAASPDTTATQMQDLFQELDRPVNILRWQQETTNPIYFRTFRTSADSVRDLGVPDGKWKTLEVEILAEYCGYGLLETPISAVTLNRDPALSNGTYVDVTGVKGDVETPVLIKWLSGSSVAGRESVFAVRRRGTPANAPYLFQAEAMTQGTDTATQVNDANFSGAGNNYSRTTFATATAMTTRLTLSDLGTAGVNLRGRYHVYLRYRKNTSGDSITIQLKWGAASATQTTNDTFTTPATTNICMADLGEIQIPRGWDPVYDSKSGTELAVSDVMTLLIQLQRVSGSGNIDLDFILLVPADDKYGIVKWVEAGDDHWWLEAEDNKTSNRNSSGQVISADYPAIAGALPYLTPNQTNRIHMVYETASGLAYALTTQTITISYYPRYLAIRPSST